MIDTLKFEMLTNHIGQLTLNQPSRRNALNAAMWANLPNLLNELSNLKDLRVLIVTGEGQHFSSGADISEFATLYATKESANKISASIANALQALASFPIPTIAVIRGACVGGGCGLALCCDIRFADSTSKFAITPAKLGLAYPYADVQRLIETVGLPNAKDILLSALPLPAKPARKMGLINHLCKVDNLAEKALDYAQNIATLSPASLKVTKQMFAAHQAGQSGESKETREWFFKGFTSEDFKEGYCAFLEKRKPSFENG